MTTGNLQPKHLRTEYLTDPIGLDEPHPRLSWKVALVDGRDALRAQRQSAYQIVVGSDAKGVADGRGELWDSGRIESGQSVFVPYGGPALRSGQRAYWTVRVWDGEGQPSTWAQPTFWEAGLLDRKEWTGQWIGSSIVGGPSTVPPVPFVRKTVTLPVGKAIRSARLYATALGLYEFHINGQRVGQDVFTPFWTDYRQRVQYQAYDVTALLLAGQANALGAILGDGWYCGYTGNINRRQFWGDRPKLLAQLVVTFTDGSTQTIATDASWQTATGPILSSDMFMGEHHDARLELTGWDTTNYATDGRWTPVIVFDVDPAIAIVPISGPPVRAIREVKPVETKPWGDQNWRREHVVDFGQNLVGRPRLRIKGPPGATVTMQFVEVLDDKGKPYTTNLRSAVQIDSYTLSGDPAGETFEPRFTFHGFRYAWLKFHPKIDMEYDLTAVVLHSEMAQTGSFECSEPLVNQLQHNIEWGQRGNFLDVPTDCPQRDERMGWTGDAQVFVRTAAFNFDVAGFFAKWTQDLRDAQDSYGEYPKFAPDNTTYDDSKEPHHVDGGPAWSDAGVICPWTMYQCFGDRALIERHWASMTKFVDHLYARAEPFGFIRSHPDWNGWHGYGDWLSQDAKDVWGNTPKDLIGTAFLAYDAQLLTKMATALGKTNDAARYAKMASDMAAVFCRRFVTPDGLIAGASQTSYVLALHFDLLPESQRPEAVAQLVRLIKSNGNRLTTGFVGSPYLNDVLTRFGRLDVAYELLMQKRWPSWLYAVTQGATTIWERWDGWTHDKGFQDPGMNSFNHYAYGAIGAWLYQRVAGLDLDEQRPGYQHVRFAPHPQTGGSLTYAKAALETIHGRVEAGWRIEGTQITYDLLVPPNVTATAILPTTGPSDVTESGKPLSNATGVRVNESRGGSCNVGLQSGRYRFTAPL